MNGLAFSADGNVFGALQEGLESHYVFTVQAAVSLSACYEDGFPDVELNIKNVQSSYLVDIQSLLCVCDK